MQIRVLLCNIVFSCETDKAENKGRFYFVIFRIIVFSFALCGEEKFFLNGIAFFFFVFRMNFLFLQFFFTLFFFYMFYH